MSAFESQKGKRRKTLKYVGTHIDPRTIAEIDVNALFAEQSRAQWLETAIDEWMKQAPPIDSTIRILANRAWLEFKNNKCNTTSLEKKRQQFAVYLSEIQSELKDKKIAPRFILAIAQELRKIAKIG